MIDSQTFAIMRDPEALTGAERITAPDSSGSSNDASRQSGLPASFVAAIAYLESWGNAESGESGGTERASCRSRGRTARIMGLQMVYSTRYKISTEKKLVRKRKGAKPIWRTVRRKIPYTVLVRDERLYPERAIPAAAQYLARLEESLRRPRLGGVRLSLRRRLRR